MDLSKLLQQKKPIPQAQLKEQGNIFFLQLAQQLETDLKFLQSQPQLNTNSFFLNTRVLKGNFDENSKKQNSDCKSEINYIFLQFPNISGFLIESDKEENTYKMYRATKVNPILNSDLGERVRPEIFVLKSKVLEEFRILDESFVRTVSSDKTLSVKQMSEMLLLLAESLRENDPLK